MSKNASSTDRTARRRNPGGDLPPRPRHERNDNGHERRNDDDGYERAVSEPCPAPPARRRLSGSAAAEYAKAHLLDLTGQPCEAVSSLSRTHDGWRVVLEVVELERIPRTTDILASYQIELDEDGELMGYVRIRRYSRNDVDGE